MLYHRTRRKSHATISSKLTDFRRITITSKLKLSVLNIINLPNNYDAQKPIGYYAAKAPQLARLAADIFSRHRRYDRVNREYADFDLRDYSRPDVIAFGTKDSDRPISDPVYFVSSKIAVVGVPTKWHAQHVSYKYLQRERLNGAVISYKKRKFGANSRKNMGYYHEAGAPVTDW